MQNILFIFLTTFLPIALTILAVTLLIGYGDNLKRKFISVFELNSEHGLVKQGLLWLAIGLPLAIGVSFGVWSWAGYSVSLNADGYKKFIEISILPLAIMSISLPLAGLVSRFHSTQQSAKQISLTTIKNNLDAYAAHRKGMHEYFSYLKPTKYFDTYDFNYEVHPVLHKRFFSGSPEKGWPNRNEDSFSEIENHLERAAKFLLPVLDGESERRLENYLEASVRIYLAAQGLHIKKITHDMTRTGVFVRWKNREDGALTLGVKTLETLAALRFTREFYNNFCDFSGRSRLKFSKDLEDVFLKTDYWLAKVDHIENIYLTEISILVKNGGADYGENHMQCQKP